MRLIVFTFPLAAPDSKAFGADMFVVKERKSRLKYSTAQPETPVDSVPQSDADDVGESVPSLQTFLSVLSI